jgi:hypothetical protein
LFKRPGVQRHGDFFLACKDGTGPVSAGQYEESA